ncbi:unnamed protein product [Rotaria socialis]
MTSNVHFKAADTFLRTCIMTFDKQRLGSICKQTADTQMANMDKKATISTDLAFIWITSEDIFDILMVKFSGYHLN